MIGFLLCVVIALIATLLGNLVPVVGAPVFAILTGALIASVVQIPAALKPGIVFSGKQLLQWSIVLLGAGLSLQEVAAGGLQSLPVMLGTFAIVMLLAYVAGRALGLDRDLRRLLGVGTAICGGSAIAAISAVIEADQADVAYALGAVFLFNVVAVLVFPPLGHLFGMSQQAFGLWAGTAINDTSSVVAAGFSYGHSAGQHGVIVKLTRTLLIVPLVVFYAWRGAQRLRAEGRSVPWRSIIPWFVLWFIVAASLNSLKLIPPMLAGPLHQLALFAIVVALAGVGLGTDAGRIRRAGLRPLALGAILWIAISIASLGIAALVRAV
ncbi:MAG TPA: putative sulfate exporter family transporter [Candidatus Aquilonibacter sp.]|nr:putative sulfate exporter family transporter [Candidatus Aquilonibacter sp.]